MIPMLDQVMALMAQMDALARPWKGLLGKCRFQPSDWVEDGQVFACDLSVSGIDDGYVVIGRPGIIAQLVKLADEQGMSEVDMAAAIVYRAKQEWAKDRREREG
jgi:hypothetical protein